MPCSCEGSMRTGGFRRYLATSSTATAFNSSVFGATATARILTPTEIASTNGIIPFGKSLTTQVAFFGAGNDNTTFDWRIWIVYRMISAAGVVGNDYLVDFGCSGSVILSGIVGKSGGVVTDSERFADTITAIGGGAWAIGSASTAPKGTLSDAQTAYNEGTAGVFTPTSTTSESIARLYLPCIARATGFIIDFDMTGATSGNALVLADDV